MNIDAPSARDRFDFDAAWAALPSPAGACSRVSSKGAAGRRLQGHLRATLPEPLLRDFARDTLGAERIRAGYLEALRVVLGNQAHAARRGYTLEQNIRVDFATAREMRTINEQMRAAGITKDHPVKLGAGRVQTVQCFKPSGELGGPSLCGMLRWEEARDDPLWKQAPPAATIPACLAGEAVPY